MIGLTVVGNPAATVMTSSPGLRARSFSCGEVQRGEREEVRTGPGVDQRTFAHADKARELTLELVGKTAGGQPEIERRIDEMFHFVGVEHHSADRDGVFTRAEFAFLESEAVVLGGEAFESRRGGLPPGGFWA